MPTAQRKNSRIDFRVSSDVKELLQQASSLADKDLCDYILDQVVPQAKREIEIESRIKLNNTEWSKFVEMIATSKPASTSAKERVRKHRKLQEA